MKKFLGIMALISVSIAWVGAYADAALSSKEEPKCVGQGEFITIDNLDAECCEGLIAISCLEPDSWGCSGPAEYCKICTRCGDGFCNENTGENFCNCQLDCPGGGCVWINGLYEAWGTCLDFPVTSKIEQDVEACYVSFDEELKEIVGKWGSINPDNIITTTKCSGGISEPIEDFLSLTL
jgi:hypothetical protein